VRAVKPRGVSALWAGLPVTALAVHMSAAEACPADLVGAHKIESSRYRLAYRTQPPQVAIGVHFSVVFAVCPNGGAPAPDRIRVDAHMPEHRHGMNYRAVVTPAGEGRYRAEGLMFHMPGRWEYVFEVRGGDSTERLTHSIVLD
jgi:hypothetical protein